MNEPQSLEIHIEELLLHGFPPGERQRIGAALQRQLEQLLSTHGLPPALGQGADMARLDAGSFNVAPGASSEAVGRQVAETVYRRLGG